MNTARAAKVFLFVAALGLALVGHADLASAKVLRWDLQDVTFNDGATASGFFTIDETALLGSTSIWPMVNFDVKTAPGVRINEVETNPVDDYTRASGGGQAFNSHPNVAAGPNFVVFRNALPIPGLSLFFSFDSDLTAAGGTTKIIPGLGNSEEQTYAGLGLQRYVTGGSVAAVMVPEPSEVLFVAVGLATLVGCSVRRTKPNT